MPVRDHRGAVVAAVSINTISGTLDETAASERFLIALRRTAQDIRTQTSPTA